MDFVCECCASPLQTEHGELREWYYCGEYACPEYGHKFTRTFV